MNWHQGLRRISLAWWGFCTVLNLIPGIALLTSDFLQGLLWIAAFSAVFAILHKVTCWVIDGFFKER